MTARTLRCAALLLSSLLAAGCGADRATAPDEQARLAAAVSSGTPTSLAAWAGSDVAINLSWQDNAPNETGIEIHRSTTGATGAFTLLKTVSANAVTYTDPGRTPLTEYCYKVRVVRAHGKTTYSDFSNVACATTFGKPDAPTSVTATRQWWGVIGVSWTAAPTATGYRLQRSPTGTDPWELATTTAATSYDDPIRAGEEQACYRVIAYNAWGESAPSPATCSVSMVSPSDLTATVVTSGGVDLHWTNHSSIADGYEVQRSGVDFVFTTLGNVGSNVSQFHDPVTAQGRYWYRVRARKGAVYSDFSNTVDALVAGSPPSAPANVSAVPSSSSQATIYWEYAAADADSFRVERSTDGQTTWTAIGITPWQQWSTQYSIGDGGLTAEQEVCYHVLAHNGAGFSTASSPSCATPMAGPTNLVAASAGSNAIRLTWTSNSNVNDGFEILREYCYDGGYYYGWQCAYATIATVGRSETSFIDSNLGPSEYYSYYVVAFKQGAVYGAYSDWSNEANATTDPAP